MRRAVERDELRRRDVPDDRPLRDAGLAVLRDVDFAVLRDAGFAVPRDAGFAVLRDAGLDAEERPAVLRLPVVERLLGDELLLAAEPRVPEPRELDGFDAALDPDAALVRAPPPLLRALLARGFAAARFGALPLRPEPVVRFDELDFGCGILLAPLRCYGRREATGKCEQEGFECRAR